MKTQPKLLSVEQRRTTLDSVTIYSEVAGSGAPLVLIHGLAGSTRWWARNIGPLAQHYQVHVVDLLGFGESRGAGAFVLREAAADLATWMDRMGLEQTSFVGHSMGGFIAAELAVDFPSRVDRLVLVDAAALPIDLALMLNPGALIQALRYASFDFLPVLLRDVYWAGVRTLGKAAYELLTSDIRAKLARIQAPTLVIWGEYDLLVPLKLGTRLMRYLPAGTQLTIIKDAGHNPMWDKPATFNRLVMDFLSRTPSTGRPGMSTHPVGAAIDIRGKQAA